MMSPSPQNQEFCGDPVSSCSAEVNSACAKVFASGENACTALTAPPHLRWGPNRAQTSICSIWKASMTSPSPQNQEFCGDPVSSCSAEVNSACAKVFASGENACTALTAPPHLRWGPNRAQTSICSIWKASMTSPSLMSWYFSMVMPHLPTGFHPAGPL